MKEDEKREKPVLKSDVQFLQEKIKERPLNRKRLLRRTMVTIAMAVVFGGVACLTFTVLEPVISHSVTPETPIQVVTFPEEEEEVTPEEMFADDSELNIAKLEEEEEEREPAVQTTPETEVEEEQVDTPVISVEEYKTMYAELGAFAREAQKSVVTVTAVASDTNWINDTLENEGETTGILIADNGRDLLILAPCEKLLDAENIIVTFSNYAECKATILERDVVTGLAVLSIPLSELPKTLQGNLQYAALGSSLGNSVLGQPVMAIGSPIGVSGSVCYGLVTSQGTALGLTDSNYKLITTDIYGSTNASGALMNMNGQIVGIIYPAKEKTNGMDNQLTAIGISELKRMVERLSNHQEIAYIGVRGQEVTNSIRNMYDMPYGAYISSIEMDSPAMNAGIQSGDIITSIDEVTVISYGELINHLVTASPDQVLHIVLQRESQGVYEEMQVEVTTSIQPGI